ncbi:MAG: curli production assembly/transport component CsgG [Acidobacteriota bacterium]
MRQARVLLIAACIVGLAVSPVWSQGAEKKRIAVLDFDFSAIQPWWSGAWDVGKGVADIVINMLVEDGTYRVIERRALENIMSEQDFSQSDRANPATAARLGKLLGVDAIVVGSITQFGTEEKKKGIGGIGGGFGGIIGGKFGKQEGKAKVGINARIVDIETGEILAVAEGTGESKRSGLLLGGLGAGGGGFGAGEVSMTSSDFRETILGEATYAAAQEVARKLVENADRLPTRKREIKGLVAYVEGSLVILNVGANHGVQPGMELKIERVTKTIKDPATGKVLRELTEEVGRVRIDTVEDESSQGTLVSGTGVQVGDVVRNE